jgi:DNA helicase-2/ATP-dependent DNA helicase PcrA
MGISEYEALQLVAKPKERGTEPQFPFSSRIVRALSGFAGIMAGFVGRRRELKLVDLFDLVVAGSGYKDYVLGLEKGGDRWENVLELRTAVQDPKYRDLKPLEALVAFLERERLESDVDGFDESVAAATLITLHQAKGLEFPVVFIVGMEESILPHFRSFDDPGQMEEERRLCYVGVTRAKQRVYLVRAFRRSLMGSSTRNGPSRFLQDIPSHLISGGDLWAGEDSQIATAMYPRDKAPDSPQVVPELNDGDHVHHAQFGNGVVVSCRVVKDDVEVVVVFNGARVKKLLLSFAKLEKVE